MKKCSKCNTEKEETEFFKNSSNKDGLNYQCKLCVTIWKEDNTEYYKTWKDKNKLKLSGYRKTYIERNRVKLLKCRKEYDKTHRYKTRLRRNLSKRIRDALNGKTKSKSTLNLIGCSLSELKTHLQNTAISNGYLNFDINNYSGYNYHIDHITPCASFDLSNEDQQRKCFHFSNLQILKAEENLKKGKKKGRPGEI